MKKVCTVAIILVVHQHWEEKIIRKSRKLGGDVVNVEESLFIPKLFFYGSAFKPHPLIKEYLNQKHQIFVFICGAVKL